MAIINNIKLRKTVETLVSNNGFLYGFDVIHTWDIINDGIQDDRPVSIVYHIMASQTNGQSPAEFEYEANYGGSNLLFHTSVMFGSATDCANFTTPVFLYNPEEGMGITIDEAQIDYDLINKLYTLKVNGSIDSGPGNDLWFTVYSELYYGKN